jgi:hypothetical protein
MTRVSIASVAGRKIYKNNNRNIELTRQYFKRLVDHVCTAIKASANFEPEREEPLKLRERFRDLYEFCAVQATDVFGIEFNPQLMTGLMIDNFDPVNAVVVVSFVQTSGRVEARYRLTFFNEFAPYATKWPDLLEANGGPTRNRYTWPYV